jgi:uncharacterized protein (TIGR00730 family)
LAESESEKAIKAAQEILTAGGKDLRSYLYREIVKNALKCRDLDTLDLKIIDRAVDEFQHAACVFKPYRSIRKVSIFGSARVKEGSPDFELAAQFARSTVENGFMVITGAADGIMRAGIEGAGIENSFGVNILLPSEQAPARIIKDDPKLVTFKYFFIRKLFFVMEADAVALFPGGFGTHDEGFEVLTLLQTGKTPPMPVVLIELPGERYWEAWDQFIRQELLTRGFVDEDDLSFYRIAHSPAEAAAWIKSYYSTYHSMRQVRNSLVIRLEKELGDSGLQVLNDRFRKLVRSGKIYKTGPLPEEADEPDLSSKPRIAFAYNQKSAGGLNQMIIAINELGRTSEESGTTSSSLG